MKRFFILTMLCLPLMKQVNADDGLTNRSPIHGIWETQDKDGLVEIYPCGNKTCGKFVWLKDDPAESPSLDDKNPTPELKKKPLCGLQFLGDFENAKNKTPNKLTNGWIYSPRHGTKFSASLKLRDENTLELRGYMLLPLLGDTQIWTRTKEARNCHMII